MNKVAYQPLPVLERAQTGDSRWSSNSAKVLRAAATFVAVFALFGAVAICSTGLRAFVPGTPGPNESVAVPVFPATKLPPSTPADLSDGIGLVPPDTNQAHQGAIASDPSAVNQTPVPALNSTPAPVSVAQPESKALESDSALLDRERPKALQNNLEIELPRAVRKKLEKERRQAEHKRSRLEEMYQKHAISSEAYKKGEEQYKSEIERYRREMNPDRGPKNEPGF
jgi:hypothetical protein